MDKRGKQKRGGISVRRLHSCPCKQGRKEPGDIVNAYASRFGWRLGVAAQARRRNACHWITSVAEKRTKHLLQVSRFFHTYCTVI